MENLGMTARNFLLLMAMMAILSLISVSTALADELPDWREYTPTGDALYDAVALEMLHVLANSQADIDFGGCIASPVYPSLEVLDELEKDYGDDPRYWLLRYWTWHAGSWFVEPEDINSLSYLLEAKKRGISDPIIEMLLYRERHDELIKNWDLYIKGELPDGSKFIPTPRGGATLNSWYIEQELDLVDQLVFNCPDESWAWYERAKVRFAYGDWEAGLDDLKQGNVASNNRFPHPFPISFIYQRVSEGLDCGNNAAAGMMLEATSHLRIPSLFPVKDPLMNQIVRMKLGAPISELAPWHSFLCRFGAMEHADQLQAYAAQSYERKIIKFLLVESPEIFTVEQRNALWKAANRCTLIRSDIKVNDSCATKDWKELEEKFLEELAGYGIDEPKSREEEIAIYQSAKWLEFRRSSHACYESINFTHFQSEQSLFSTTSEHFDHLSTFDFETFSWPEGE